MAWSRTISRTISAPPYSASRGQSASRLMALLPSKSAGLAGVRGFVALSGPMRRFSGFFVAQPGMLVVAMSAIETHRPKRSVLMCDQSPTGWPRQAECAE